jgi:phosphoglycerol transferase MdoB-like AlkP superfamily enzyme
MNARRILANPVGTWALFFAFALVTLTLFRLGLLAWQWDRLVGVDHIGRVFTLGLRLDVVMLCSLTALPGLLHLLLPASRARNDLALLLLTVSGSLLVFMELATPEFIKEFDNRPDRLFFEYLDHPHEVFGMLWHHHRLALAGIPPLFAALVWGQWRGWKAWLAGEAPWSWLRRLAALPVVIVLLFVGARGLDHRPINLSHAAFSSNRLANELVPNSTYTLLYAAYARRSETDVGRIYGRMPWAEVQERVRKYMRVPAADFTDRAIPTLHRSQAAPRRGPPLNLVILLEESLGAGFVGSLGGLPLTPNLDRLSQQGWSFTHLYATGTRTARGMEAMAAGFPPTPAPAVLKLPRAQSGFFTLGELLRRQGYATDFIYGGVANFDNMRGFYLANGFDRVIEQQDFDQPVFLGSWGVSDEDWVVKAHETLVAHGDKPFFALMMSTTNHDPFEYPEGRIEPYEQPPFTRNNAVKFADYAIGKFFELARGAKYFERTIFVVVADHDARVFGADLVPVEHFRIPGVIVGPGVPVRRDQRVTSQMDLGPTLVHLLGLAVEHPMTGRDLLALPGDDPGLALMQYDNQHGFRYGNRLVVHQEKQPAVLFTVGPDDQLKPAPADPELIKDALAHALWPGEAYNRRQYRLPEKPQGSE